MTTDPFSQEIFTPPPLKWYQRWWVIVLLVFFVILFIFVGGFGLAVWYFKKNIDEGKFYNPFTGELTSELPFAPSSRPENVKQVSVDNDPYKGSVYAPVTIIAFEDFQCPFCKEVQPIIHQVLNAYGDQILFVYRDFPLIGVHEDAENAAQAAQCAHEQGKFWEYHDVLFENQDAMDIPSLKQYATALGLDAATFNSCVDGKKYSEEVMKDLRDGLTAGADATPTWFINGVKYRGVMSFDQFKTIINAEIQYGKGKKE